uniref:Ig-like domain-containing protein n=1 Tax=Oryzias latipes TaxID=8090 RepID=A0A3P9JLM7_ORYLA
MMISKLMVFFLTCVFVGADGQKTYLKSSSFVWQKSGFLSVNVGDTVTLECSYEGYELTWISWYKQSLGGKPELMSSFYAYSTEVTFFDEFKDNSRFKLDIENKSHHLKILNLQISDSATYYCAVSYAMILKFTEGVTVNVKGSGLTVMTSVDQSSSENIHAGDSVTLNCTVHTGSCDEEHRVYWFRDSEDSHPGLTYTHGGRNDQCERKNTQTHSCVYELPILNLHKSHAGIYYCAVVSCGHILFGNGTKLDLTGDFHTPFLVYLFTSLIVIIATLSLTSTKVRFILMRLFSNIMSIQTFCIYSKCHLNSVFLQVKVQEAESLQYATVDVKRMNRSKRQKNDASSQCIYTSVREKS